MDISVGATVKYNGGMFEIEQKIDDGRMLLLNNGYLRYVIDYEELRKQNNEDDRCVYCKYYRHYGCVRHAPVTDIKDIGSAIFPKVSEYDWCGEFEEKEAPWEK